jgi:hypothetical protein
VSDESRERALEAALFDLYQRWRDELGYRAERFRQLIVPGCKRYKGGVGAIKHVLTTRTAGFDRLKDHPELTVEYLAISGAWDDLIPEMFRNAARNRLAGKSK